MTNRTILVCFVHDKISNKTNNKTSDKTSDKLSNNIVCILDQQ